MQRFVAAFALWEFELLALGNIALWLLLRGPRALWRAQLKRELVRLRRYVKLQCYVCLVAGFFSFFGIQAGSQSLDSATCGVKPGENLIVFVGRRIQLREITKPRMEANGWQMDYQFRATYEVLDLVCGRYDSEQIRFDVYDHYGEPYFAQFETVLLFVSRYDGRLVHQKYQFSDVYRTADGSWAGCGDPYKYEPEVHRGPIRARPMRYESDVTFSVSGLSEAEIRERYPSDYFSRRGDIVICQAGATLTDLFAVKRDGVLRARGLFK